MSLSVAGKMVYFDADAYLMGLHCKNMVQFEKSWSLPLNDPFILTNPQRSVSSLGSCLWGLYWGGLLMIENDLILGRHFACRSCTLCMTWERYQTCYVWDLNNIFIERTSKPSSNKKTIPLLDYCFLEIQLSLAIQSYLIICQSVIPYHLSVSHT